MAIPLAGKMARAAGRALMPGLWKSGLGPNQIYKALKNTYKLSWRRGVMFKDIREVTGLMKHQLQWKGLKPEQKPYKFLFNDVDLPAGRVYRSYADVDMLNNFTGETVTQKVSFYHDEFENYEQVMNEYISFYNMAGSKKEWEITGYNFLTAEHNRGAPW